MIGIHRINPPIVVVTPKGDGLALFLIDYGPDLNSIWIVRDDASGAIYHVCSAEIKVGGNEMWNLKEPSPFTERNV